MLFSINQTTNNILQDKQIFMFTLKCIASSYRKSHYIAGSYIEIKECKHFINLRNSSS